MNVLITGASGLIGSAVSLYFLDNGFNVTGITNSSSEKIDHSAYNQISMDLVNSELEINNMVYDLVIHCAAILPEKYNFDEKKIVELSQKIDQNIFNYCNKHKIKLIYFSAAYLYSEKSILNENVPLRVDLKGYYLSKKMSEDYLQKSFLNFIIFRVSSPYGNIKKQTNVIRIFADKIKNNLPVTLIGKGERRQNFIHLSDISEACFLAIKSKPREIYNLTHTKNYSMLDMASQIKEIYSSKSEFLFDVSRSDKMINVNFDNSKIIAALNWNPKLDLRLGLIKTFLH